MDIFKHLEEHERDKRIKQEDNAANQVNANKGTAGTNRQYDQAQGNRGEQLNPNRKAAPIPPAIRNEDDDEDGGMVFGP